jgi:hypothetical protein
MRLYSFGQSFGSIAEMVLENGLFIYVREMFAGEERSVGGKVARVGD